MPKLRPDLYSYPITNTVDISTEGNLALDGKLAKVFDPAETVRHIGLTNRSVFEILNFAAASIDVPEDDIAKGLVRKRDIELDQYLDVRTSEDEPFDAWLKVQYRDTWYYIPTTNLPSRTTFTLLSALFSSVVGEVPGAKPVLTLSVN